MFLLSFAVFLGFWNGTVSLQYIQDSNIVHDLVLTSSQFSRPAGSSSHCALLCMSFSVGCTLFAYDTIDSVCIGYELLPPSFTIVINKAAEQRMISYRIKRGNPEQDCKDIGYFYNNDYGLCWRFSGNKATFSDAVDICKDSGATMVIHVTLEKATYINDVNAAYGIQNAWYMGLTDIEMEGDWRWLDGSVNDWTFLPGTANDYDENCIGESADCAVVRSDQVHYDAYCGSLYGFVCERRNLV